MAIELIYRKFIEERDLHELQINQINIPYKDKLQKLYEYYIISNKIQHNILKKINKDYIYRIARTRNNFIHNDSHTQYIFKGEELFEAHEILKLVIECCILIELGFSNSLINHEIKLSNLSQANSYNYDRKLLPDQSLLFKSIFNFNSSL